MAWKPCGSVQIPQGFGRNFRIRKLDEISVFYAVLRLDASTGETVRRSKSDFMKSDVYETGITDHHKIIFPFSKNTFSEGKLKTFFHPCYNKFDQKSFNEEYQIRYTT